MKHIRRLIYWLGFKPKYPSIWFSPSAHILRASKGIDWKAVMDSFGGDNDRR